MYWKWDSNRTTSTFAKFMQGAEEHPTVTAEKVKKTKSEYQRARNLADQWFSRYIRLKYSFKGSDGELYCKCYTCDRIKDIKKIDNGHWVPRANLQVRFHPNNARPQCTYCNHFRHGEHDKFRANLIKEIGIEKVEQIEKLGQVTLKVSSLELRKKAKYFREECKTIQDKHQIKIW